MEVLEKLIGMSNKKIAYLGLAWAKMVTISKPRQCSKCNKQFEEYTEMCTASRYIDKKYNKTATEVIDSGESLKNYKFVMQRHWICKDCLVKMLDNPKFPFDNKPKRKKANNHWEGIEMYSEEYENLSLEEQLDFIIYAYENGELDWQEYQDIENAIIHHIALQEAEGIGQE